MNTQLLEQEVETPTHYVHMNTAMKAGWVLADESDVSHVEGNPSMDMVGKAVRKRGIVYGFAHEATGRMFVTTVYYRIETVDRATGKQRYGDETICPNPYLQAWANLSSTLSCK